jgi:hypothetical protein
MSAIRTALTSWIWIWPGIGLLGLCIYQLSVGQYDAALHSFLNALAVLGLRHVDAKTDEAVAAIQSHEVEK